MQSRRGFLKKLSLLSTSLVAPTFLVNGLRGAQGVRRPVEASNRILILVELAGGCDGLNTVIPYTNDAYRRARPVLGFDASDGLLELDDRYAFHPSMSGFKSLWDSGKLGIVQGVGYPNPNRSHFRSMDIWQTAEAQKVSNEGWLAKYFQENQIERSLEGVNIGGQVPRSMMSEAGASPSIENVELFQLHHDPLHPGDAPSKNAAYQRILSEPHNQYLYQNFVTETVLEATLSSVALLEGVKRYQSTVEYPATAFASNLKTIAQIIAADLGVIVYYTAIDGFDTHANQAVGGQKQAGRHASLLETVSEGLLAFQEDLAVLGRDQDALIVTFSEFGRRLDENESLGTDHGTANQMFFIGNSVNPGFYGTHPSLERQHLDAIGDMIYSVDFRSVYATILARWLATDPIAVLGADWSDPSLSMI